MQFYKDRYDVIVIGGALAGLASALMLADKGRDVLVLERHNLPGGLATSFVRGEFEFEATLHEMMSIGPAGQRLKVGKFLDDMGVKIDWLQVPEAYRLVMPNKGIDVTLHYGFERVAREVDAAVPGTYRKVLELLNLCQRVYDSVNELSVRPVSKPVMLLRHGDFVKTAGYSAREVLATFDLPEKAVDILSAYWIYVGNTLNDLPFTVYAVLMADYLSVGSYVPRRFSHEMSLAMAQRAEELGVQIEYRQQVEKILVRDGAVVGVRTARGDEIRGDYVISGAYPNAVYANMIDPPEAVPEKAFRMLNARRLSVTSCSVEMILDGTPESLGIRDYSIFSGSSMDPGKIWPNMNTRGPYDYLTAICLNLANPGCVPEGYTQLSITTLPKAEPWFDVKPEEYNDAKRAFARQMIEAYCKIYGVNLFDHIVEIEIIAPMTIAHYAGSWNGQIYGYMHSQDDNIVARLQTAAEEKFIRGLEFAGAHAISGNGMGPAITNGRKAAKNVLDDMVEKEAAR